MFIEKLSVEQVKEFLNSIYPEKQGFDYSMIMPEESNPQKEYVYVNVERDRNDFNLNIRLEDYDATISCPNKWLKFLYKVFGEEYKQAYIQECLSVFDED